jgi:excisionase family DNA binding protein
VLRLDRLLGDADDGKAVKRLLAVLQGVRMVNSSDWESVCPAMPDHRGACLYIRIVDGAPVAWCTNGCSDEAVLTALTERLSPLTARSVHREERRAEPPTMPIENRARISEAKTPAASPSTPLGSEAFCESCSKTIVKTRRSRRFCSNLCRDVFHGRRKAQEAEPVAPASILSVKTDNETESPAVPTPTPPLGLTEAALVLNCHRRTVRAYIRAGLFPGRLLAGRWKIRREDLGAFIEGALRPRNEPGTTAPAASFAPPEPEAES